MNLRGEGIGVPDRVFQRIRQSGAADDPAAVCDQLSVLQCGARDIDLLPDGIRDLQREAFFIMFGIARRRENDAAGVLPGKLHFDLAEPFLGDRPHDGEEVALQKRKHHLGLGIAEAAVVFDDLRAVFGDQLPEVEAALEAAALGVHGAERRQEDFFHTPCRDFRGVIRIRRDGAHAAGVETGVVVSGALVVHAGDHWDDGFSVGEREHRDFGTFEVFFDHDLIAAVTELFLLHHLPHGPEGLLPGLGDDDALAEGKPVGLDHSGDGGRFQIAQSLFHVGEDLIARCRNAVLLHQILGEDLAAFNDRRLAAGTETRDPGVFQRVDTAQNQGIVRRHHGIVNFVGYGKGDNGRDILGADRHAFGILRHAAVAGQGVDLRDFRIFL